MAVQIIDKVIVLLFKMAAMIKKLLPATLVAKVGLSVVEFTKAEATLLTFANITRSATKDPYGYANPAITSATAANECLNNESTMSYQEIDDALDLEK